VLCLFVDAMLKVLIDAKHGGNVEITNKHMQYFEQISELVYAQGGSPHLFIEWLCLSMPKIDL
jgi:hypothetical protein